MMMLSSPKCCQHELSQTLIETQIDTAGVAAPINAYYCPGRARILRTIVNIIMQPDLRSVQKSAEEILQAQQEGGWGRGGGSHKADRAISILNHSALAAMLRYDVLADDPEMVIRVQRYLGESWRNLTGAMPDPTELLRPLPWRVMVFADAVVRGVHQACLAEKNHRVPQELARAMRRFTEDSDYFTVREKLVAVLALLLAPQFIAGLTAGYIIWSISEAMFHQKIYHPSQTMKRRLARYVPLLARRLGNAERQHRVHHGFYSRSEETNYVTPLDKVSPARAAAVRARLEKDGVGWIARQEFGATFGFWSTVVYGANAVPGYVAVGIVLLALGGGTPALLGLVLASVCGPLNTTIAHRYLHMSTSERERRTPAWLKPYIRSHHFKLMSRFHCVHHEAEQARRAGEPTVANAIVPGSIGDRVFGTFIHTTPAHRKRFQDLGI